MRCVTVDCNLRGHITCITAGFKDTSIISVKGYSIANLLFYLNILGETDSKVIQGFNAVIFLENIPSRAFHYQGEALKV